MIDEQTALTMLADGQRPLRAHIAELEAAVERLREERDHYKAEMLAVCKECEILRTEAGHYD